MTLFFTKIKTFLNFRKEIEKVSQNLGKWRWNFRSTHQTSSLNSPFKEKTLALKTYFPCPGVLEVAKSKT